MESRNNLHIPAIHEKRMIVITGINGFIGSEIARLLVKGGRHVRGLVRKTSNLINLTDIKSKIELMEGDIRNKKTVQQLLSGAEVCYHTAALVRVGRFTTDEYFSTNLHGTMNICEEAHSNGIKRFIHISTCETLRPPICRRRQAITPITEDLRNSYSDMIGNYAKSKFLAEGHVRACAAEGLPAVIINPTAVIGPGDVNLTTPGYFMLQYLKGRIPAYFETGFNIVDVRDVARGAVLAEERGKVGERYTLGTHNVMLTALFRMLKKISGRRPISLKLPYFIIAAGARLLGSQTMPAKKVRASRWPFFLDSLKAVQELDWRPSFDLQVTLKDAWEWYLINDKWQMTNYK